MKFVLLCCLAAAFVCTSFAARPLDAPLLLKPKNSVFDEPVKNAKPLIGILAQACHYCPGRSYVAAGFVKWIEAAGARAVPIRYYSSDAELHRLFKSVNGIIFPGGLTDLWMDSPYVIAARKIWQWAKEANDAGDVFPIHGTCLGFQLLHILEANVSFTQLLVDTDAVAHATTLEFTTAAKSSTMFGGMSPDLIAKLEDPAWNIAMENHMFGLPPDHYQKWPALAENFDILSTAQDRGGVEYVSSAEHKSYPFYATQWHPEKPPYEFGMTEIPHSLQAVLVSQHMANVFVDTARRSSHTPESPEQELELMIYNWRPYFTLKDSVMDPSYDGPDMTYFFDKRDEPDNDNELSGADDKEEDSRDKQSEHGHRHAKVGKRRGSKSFAGHLAMPTGVDRT